MNRNVNRDLNRNVNMNVANHGVVRGWTARPYFGAAVAGVVFGVRRWRATHSEPGF